MVLHRLQLRHRENNKITRHCELLNPASSESEDDKGAEQMFPLLRGVALNQR